MRVKLTTGHVVIGSRRTRGELTRLLYSDSYRDVLDNLPFGTTERREFRRRLRELMDYLGLTEGDPKAVEQRLQGCADWSDVVERAFPCCEVTADAR